MEEAPVTAPPEQATKLTSEQRSKIMSEAAKRRWAKAKRAGKSAKGKPHAKGKIAAKAAKAKPMAVAPPRVSTAIKAAEKQLTDAITARGRHFAEYTFHQAHFIAAEQQIAYLVPFIQTLNNPPASLPEYVQQRFSAPVQAPTMDQIMADQPLQYQSPRPPYQPPQIPVIPVPQTRHPVNTAGRAGGGAVGGQLQEEEDEDRFLKESDQASGQWR